MAFSNKYRVLACLVTIMSVVTAQPKASWSALEAFEKMLDKYSKRLENAADEQDYYTQVTLLRLMTSKGFRDKAKKSGYAVNSKQTMGNGVNIWNKKVEAWERDLAKNQRLQQEEFNTMMPNTSNFIKQGKLQEAREALTKYQKDNCHTLFSRALVIYTVGKLHEQKRFEIYQRKQLEAAQKVQEAHASNNVEKAKHWKQMQKDWETKIKSLNR